MKISVLIKEPGKKPRHVHIENSLENLQNTLFGVDFVGTIVLCGIEGESFCDMPGKWKEWKLVFAPLWEDA